MDQDSAHMVAASKVPMLKHGEFEISRMKGEMDVKSAFLYGSIEEEVYICQPPGFEDPEFLDNVYKVKKHCMEYIKLLKHDEFYGRTYILLGIRSKAEEGWEFISQDKYVVEILKKFRFTKVKNASTPMETPKPLLKDEDGKEVDVHMYRSMIGSLMYLTSSRPDIMFAVCTCARYQVNLKVLHLHAMKRIFRYLKGQPKLELWYPKDSPFDFVAYTDSDYPRASLDRKSIIGGSAIPTDPHHTPTILQPSSSQPQKTQKPKKPKRKDTQVPQLSSPTESVADEAVYKELDDILVRAATTTSSLEAEQDSARVDSSKDEQSLGEDASKQGRKINDIDADKDITLVNDQDDAEILDVNDLHGEEVFVEKEVADKE
nr:hypothetical protein [Tanacetum cinerariifolium]